MYQTNQVIIPLRDIIYIYIPTLGSQKNLREDLSIGTKVYTLTARDDDITSINRALKYSIKHGDSQGVFAIDANTGQVLFYAILSLCTMYRYCDYYWVYL